jgi:hypothetical protein
MPLVPSYSCTAPNTVHGSPLAFPSCAPTHQTSDFLTVGTPDANGNDAKSVGYVRLDVVPGNPATPEDDADVRVAFHMSDVRKAGTLADYTGQLRASVVVRLTDGYNGVSGDFTDPATAIDFPFPVVASCGATGATDTGAACGADTSFDAIVPGAVREGARANWQMGTVEVYDGGSDGDSSTASDDTLFARQGVFVP